MSSIMCFVEVREGKIKKSSLEAISEASRLAKGKGWSVSAVIAGKQIDGLADVVGNHGASSVYLANHSDLEFYSPEGYTTVIMSAFSEENPVVCGERQRSPSVPYPDNKRIQQVSASQGYVPLPRSIRHPARLRL